MTSIQTKNPVLRERIRRSRLNEVLGLRLKEQLVDIRVPQQEPTLMKSAASALEVSTATVSHRRQRLTSSKPVESTSTFYQALNSAKANTHSQKTLKQN